MIRKQFTVAAIAAASLLAVNATSVIAQNATANPRGAANDVGQLDDKTVGANVRASQLLGLNIQNSQGESVGEIHDLVVDGNSGKIRYAAVTYGGFLGLGDKLFAVPFEAFTVRQNPDDPGDAGDVVMVLNVTKEQLEGAQGFDQDRWPNMADKNMMRELDKRYGVRRTPMRNRGNLQIDADTNRRDVNVDVNRN